MAVDLSCQGVIDQVIGRVEKAGGKIFMPKFQIEGAGFIAMIMDTEGNSVGLPASSKPFKIFYIY